MGTIEKPPTKMPAAHVAASPVVIVRPHSTELRLRQEKDATELLALTNKNRTYWREGLSWLDGHTTIQHSLGFIKLCQKRFENQEGLDLGIWHNGALVGSVGLHSWGKSNGTTTMGYCLDEGLKGRGIMIHSVRALTFYGFRYMPLKCIEIECAKDNKRSRTIPRALSFTETGEVRHRLFYGAMTKFDVFSMMVEDWTGEIV